MDELVAALRAALDETERIARDVEGERWYFDLIEDGKRAFEEHINSDWVLRQVAAHRKILELHVSTGWGEPCCVTCASIDKGNGLTGDPWPCPTLLAVAEAYGIEVPA